MASPPDASDFGRFSEMEALIILRQLPMKDRKAAVDSSPYLRNLLAS